MRQLSEIMQSIQQGIVERQTQEAQPVAKDPEWEKAKDYVDSLPADYLALVKKNGIKGFESRSGKLNRTQFDLGVYQGMPLQLVEYTRNDGGVEKAWYVLFNNKKFTAYRREL